MKAHFHVPFARNVTINLVFWRGTNSAFTLMGNPAHFHVLSVTNLFDIKRWCSNTKRSIMFQPPAAVRHLLKASKTIAHIKGLYRQHRASLVDVRVWSWQIVCLFVNLPSCVIDGSTCLWISLPPIPTPRVFFIHPCFENERGPPIPTFGWATNQP